jgi:hypothetical protein
MGRCAGAQVDAVPVHLPRDLVRPGGAARIRPGDARGQWLAFGIDGDKAVHGRAEADAANASGLDPGRTHRAADGDEDRSVDLLRVLLGYAWGGREQWITGSVVPFNLALAVEDDRLGAGGSDIDTDDRGCVGDHGGSPRR